MPSSIVRPPGNSNESGHSASSVQACPGGSLQRPSGTQERGFPWSRPHEQKPSRQSPLAEHGWFVSSLQVPLPGSHFAASKHWESNWHGAPTPSRQCANPVMSHLRSRNGSHISSVKQKTSMVPRHRPS